MIGVVIRTLNEAELIGTCLETLERQRSRFDLDILVVDSGSTDATLAIARSHGVRIYDLPPDDFDYSKSLNVGIEQVRGRSGADPLRSRDPRRRRVGRAHGRAVRRPAGGGRGEPAGAVGGRAVARGAAAGAAVRRRERASHSRESPNGLIFSNAASCIRRSVWLEQPFTLPAAEDLEWAERVVGAGWSVVYEPAAAVYHSHDESARAQAQRLIDINRVDVGGAATRRKTLREAAGSCTGTPARSSGSTSRSGASSPTSPSCCAWSSTTWSTSRGPARPPSAGARTPELRTPARRGAARRRAAGARAAPARPARSGQRGARRAAAAA